MTNTSFVLEFVLWVIMTLSFIISVSLFIYWAIVANDPKKMTEPENEDLCLMYFKWGFVFLYVAIGFSIMLIASKVFY